MYMITVLSLFFLLLRVGWSKSLQDIYNQVNSDGYMSPQHKSRPKELNYLFAFGDSYTATSTNLNKTKPSLQNPIGNPSFPGITTSGGPNWVGYFTTTYNDTPTIAWNFAWSGATVDSSLALDPGVVLSLIDQTKEFQTTVASHPPSVPWTSDNTLFTVWIGINDIRVTYSLPNFDGVLTRIMDRYFEQVEIMYAAGGRNFIFLNVPPFQRSLQVTIKPELDQKLEAAGIVKFNDALDARVKNFTETHPDGKILLVNTTGYFNEALDHPKRFGAKDSSCLGAIVGDSAKCIWWDVLHPGIALHRRTAKVIGQIWETRFFQE